MYKIKCTKRIGIAIRRNSDFLACKLCRPGLRNTYVHVHKRSRTQGRRVGTSLCARRISFFVSPRGIDVCRNLLHKDLACTTWTVDRIISSGLYGRKATVARRHTCEARIPVAAVPSTRLTPRCSGCPHEARRTRARDSDVMK